CRPRGHDQISHPRPVRQAPVGRPDRRRPGASGKQGQGKDGDQSIGRAPERNLDRYGVAPPWVSTSTSRDGPGLATKATKATKASQRLSLSRGSTTSRISLVA